MKKLLPLSILMVFTLTGCPFKDDPVTPNAICTSTAASCPAAGTFEACSDGKSSWYNWNGKKYPCNGNDCNSAATNLTNDIIAFCK